MKPNIYLIADKNNEALAQELLQGNVYRITSMKRLLLTMEMYSGVIIIIVNEVPSKYLLHEIQHAVDICRHSEQFSLLPIVLNDAAVPNILEQTAFFRLDETSVDEKIKARNQINAYIQGGNIEGLKKGREKRKKELNNNLTIMTVLAGIFTVIISIMFAYIGEQPFMADEYTISIVALLISLTVALIAVTYTYILKASNKKEIEEDSIEYRKKLFNIFEVDKKTNGDEDSAGENIQTEDDVLKRMQMNLDDINEYYKWSKIQAKGAYRLACSMCISGVILIGVAVLSALAFSTPINVTIITGIGGVIVEVVAGTVLVVYKSSLSQLNHYHQALHEDERFLSSVTLISKLSSDEVRDEALKEIIRSELEMNLATIKKVNVKEA